MQNPVQPGKPGIARPVILRRGREPPPPLFQRTLKPVQPRGVVKNFHLGASYMFQLRDCGVMLLEKFERGAWEAARVVFAVAVLVLIVSIALMLLHSLGLAHPSPLTWYALGYAVGTSLGLAAQLALASLAARGLRRALRGRAAQQGAQR